MLFHLKGSILNISFLDSNGALVPLNAEAWKDKPETNVKTGTSSLDQTKRSLSVTRTGSSGGIGSSKGPTKVSPTSNSPDIRDSHLVVMVSEKQARIFIVPLQICAHKIVLTDTSFTVRADVVFLKNLGELSRPIVFRSISIYSLFYCRHSLFGNIPGHWEYCCLQFAST